MINGVRTDNGKSVTDVLQDFKIEFSTFIATRLQMLQEEMRLKTSGLKSALPLLVIGGLLLATAWFLFTAALVAVIAAAFAGNPWAYAISFAIVGALYAIFGGMLALMGKNALMKNKLKPEKTIRILQEDRAWFQTEAARIKAS